MNNPGMLLWLWLLIAPIVAMVLMSGAGSSTTRYDRPDNDQRPRV